ncbi:uncharacterized protein OCT59_025134 [Rhizophagus irregularis]|uniref:Uncharacterized protein n=3 Tax=Rhizophagus irregularis TaxID=588596 RepID=A0A915Z4V0_9GLOM|nr:hypothetical protein RirG_267670 [Rhizophagus irregularis DAOM 197198w]UZO04769.1 hypothetical protein OCT59_025134 [Rhizophagus irregularis]GBC11913.1 hypothetical protein RIR_jg34773.t1 [Rhizophagus irregularis DAOM 181602=DAOM 197198]CAB4490310.1 unnamed protein product [Rhizophagus irregularis]CAB5186965.1 unnamed protein product [Rhizophagus irregularis]
MSGINPSIDNVSSFNNTSAPDMPVGPNGGDKYENSRHLNYGQTDQKKPNNESRRSVRRYSASSDTKPVLVHTFQEEILGGLTGDDLIKMEEEKEKVRKKKDLDQRKKSV